MRGNANSTQDAPDLSVVVTARNDDHGGNLLRRMQIFVSAFLEQARRHGLSSELIIVEWNPPSERPPLAEALTWPTEPGPCAVRIIEVSPALHRRHAHWDKLPLFQMIAKNVGIRRARGRFVLATNIDLLFSDGLIRFLGSGRLDPRCMYRLDRHDVPADVPVGVPVAEQLSYCRRNVIRINSIHGTFERGEFGAWVRSLTLLLPSALQRAGDPIAGAMPYLRQWLPHWPDARRAYDTTLLRRFIRKRVELARIAGTRFQAGVRTGVQVMKRSRVDADGLPPLKRLHCNACGDFTLLAREVWSRVRGYPEWEMFSLHLDTVLLYMASLSGMREVVLGGSQRIYHVEHGSGWTPEQMSQVRERMMQKGLPMLGDDELWVVIEGMRRDPSKIVANRETWGLAGEELRETLPLSRVVDSASKSPPDVPSSRAIDERTLGTGSERLVKGDRG